MIGKIEVKDIPEVWIEGVTTVFLIPGCLRLIQRVCDVEIDSNRFTVSGQLFLIIVPCRDRALLMLIG